MSIGYQPWDANAVEARLIEASATSMRMPDAGGPSRKTGFWPEAIGLYPTGMKIRVRPSPAEITLMDEALGWINRWLAESDRKTLRAWLFFRVSKGRSVAQYAETAGMNSKTLRRFVIRCCQRIAQALNKKRHPLKGADVAEVSGNLVRERPDSLPVAHPKKSPSYIRPADAVPKHDGNPEAVQRVEREIAKHNRRMKRARQHQRGSP